MTEAAGAAARRLGVRLSMVVQRMWTIPRIVSGTSLVLSCGAKRTGVSARDVFGEVVCDEV